MIQERLRQGVYVKDVAAELGVHPRTVSRARQRGAAPAGRRPAARHSKLDAYKPEVDRLLAAGVWNAVAILRELQERGSSVLFRKFVDKIWQPTRIFARRFWSRGRV
jgi:transposase